MVPAETSSTSGDIVGLALNKVDSAEELVRVLSRGIGSAKIYDAPDDVLLNDNTNDDIYTVVRANFKDSGGSENPYGNNENYSVRFDSGYPNGDWYLTFNSFQFEHWNGMFDRLGVQTSNDGDIWTNASVSWWHKTSEVDPPWNVTLDPNLTPLLTENGGGWIIPMNPSFASSITDGNYSPVVKLEGAQWIKFFFHSDHEWYHHGWDISLRGTAANVAPIQRQPFNFNDSLELDPADPTNVIVGTTDPIARVVSDFSNNHSVLVRL